jgi:hypothetical protein
MKKIILTKFQYTNARQSITASSNKYSTLHCSAVIFACVATAVLAAGCARLPDKTVVASSISTQFGYPGKLTEKRTTASAAKSKRTLPVRLAGSGYIGKAPYICTPSGFGRTSDCFLRPKFRRP